MALYGALAKAPADQGVNLKIAAGAYTAVAGDDSAGAATIDTGLSSVRTFFVDILRSDVSVKADADLSVSGGTLTVADGSATYAVTAGDVIHWLAIGE